MRRTLIAAPAALLVTVGLAGAALVAGASPASAHVVPSTTIELDVHQSDITAALTLPTEDLTAASGINVPESDGIDQATAREVADYLEEHVVVTSGSGDADEWDVQIADVATTATEQWGTGQFAATTAVATLTPQNSDDLRSFTLDYDAIIHQVVSADIYVILRSDWAAGEVESARNLGAIQIDTVTGAVPALAVDLDDSSMWQGFASMVSLGIGHIAEGTDHQLFLLTLLLPAPLIAARRRWSGVASRGSTVRRITAITLAFTLGHSLTLALGTLGLPAPQQAIEALIAVSILVAAAHAIRPLFPGREPLIAGLFGLIHGMAFSTTLSALQLSGGQLALSLLGFNLGIEAMQLLVVMLVLPPLVLLARSRAYMPLRVAAALITAVAATGWLLDRVGVPNPAGDAANGLGTVSPFIVAALWAAAAGTLVARRARREPEPHGTPTAGASGPMRVVAHDIGPRGPSPSLPAARAETLAAGARNSI